MKNFTVKIAVQLDAQFLSDVLVTAAEGGINYWARITNAVYERIEDDPKALVGFDVSDAEDPVHSETFTVTLETISYAIQAVLDSNAMLRKDIREAIVRSVMAGEAGDIDAEAADCLVQIGVLGGLVYG